MSAVDLEALTASATAFAKYHAERAEYGGASREFHERATSFLFGTVFAVAREIRELRAEVARLEGELAEEKRRRWVNDSDAFAKMKP